MLTDEGVETFFYCVTMYLLFHSWTLRRLVDFTLFLIFKLYLFMCLFSVYMCVRPSLPHPTCATQRTTHGSQWCSSIMWDLETTQVISLIANIVVC